MVIINFIFLLWYGKLPKVSLYHQQKYPFKDIFEDETIQSRIYPDKTANRRAIENFIYSNSKLLSSDYPLLDEMGKKIGTQTLCSKLVDINRNK